MHDLRADLAAMERSAARLSSPNGSRAIMFVGAEPGAGTTSAAVSFSLRVEPIAARAVWLVDLNFAENACHRAFTELPFDAEGALSRPYDASLGAPPLYSLSPETQLEAAARGSRKLLSVHQVGKKRLLVSRMRTERLEPRLRIQFRDSPAWWPAVRTAADWIIVDAPALSRSGAALNVARHMDGVVLVMKANNTRADEAMQLRQDIEANGGRVIGVMLNRMDRTLHRATTGRLRAVG